MKVKHQKAKPKHSKNEEIWAEETECARKLAENKRKLKTRMRAGLTQTQQTTL